jgi:TonB family protein
LARQTGTQGNVVVSADVEVNGDITNVRAVSGPMFLRGAAVESVKRWKYAPALVDGKPARATVTVGVEFKLH